VFIGWLGPPLLAALADELQQHHEQVDEVEIERQRTHQRLLGQHVTRIGFQVDLLDALRVPGGEASEDDNGLLSGYPVPVWATRNRRVVDCPASVWVGWGEIVSPIIICIARSIPFEVAAGVDEISELCFADHLVWVNAVEPASEVLRIRGRTY
jgi:hypothetical protein